MSFFSRILKKPPMLFPWIALFHILMLLFSIWSVILSPFPSEDWIQPLWAFLLVLTWLFVCDLRKWAALSYIGLTMLNLLLRFFLLHTLTDIAIYSFGFFEITILCCFFILFYFKRFAS